jgi:hypothetical protein
MPLVGIETLPTPFSPASVPLPPETGGRGHTSLRVGGWGESQFRRGAYTVVLFTCTYFVEGRKHLLLSWKVLHGGIVLIFKNKISQFLAIENRFLDPDPTLNYPNSLDPNLD